LPEKQLKNRAKVKQVAGIKLTINLKNRNVPPPIVYKKRARAFLNFREGTRQFIEPVSNISRVRARFGLPLNLGHFCKKNYGGFSSIPRPQ
jgi:hypothetical protein